MVAIGSDCMLENKYATIGIWVHAIRRMTFAAEISLSTSSYNRYIAMVWCAPHELFNTQIRIAIAIK